MIRLPKEEARCIQQAMGHEQAWRSKQMRERTAAARGGVHKAAGPCSHPVVLVHRRQLHTAACTVCCPCPMHAVLLGATAGRVANETRSGMSIRRTLPS